LRTDAEGFEIEYDSDCSANVRLDRHIYCREALLRACYWGTNSAYIHIPESPDDRLVVRIKLKHSSPTLENPKPISIREFVGEFCNALLDFELRRQVEAETAELRQLILAKAFSEAGVLEDEPPGTVEDPVGRENKSSFVQIVNDPAAPRN
jgi:His-Xaa-Ser system protein HxsD